MDSLQQTIDGARAKGMDDAVIKNLLIKTGWDADIVDAGLHGIFVPTPQAANSPLGSPVNPPDKSATHITAKDSRPTLSALEAAMHHVLLWFFTLSMTITIGVAAETLFGTSKSVEALTSFLATSVVTLVAFGFFYARYLRRLRREPTLTANRVWSIITIVLHSVGTMAALITLIAAGINGVTLSVLIAAAVIAALDGLVVATYVNATFVKEPTPRRRLVLKAFPILVVLLLVGFMVASITKVGPLRSDSRLQADMVSAAAKVRDYAKDNRRLPNSAAGLGLPAGVEYQYKSPTSYALCGSFKTSSESDGYPGYDSSDAYVSSSNFSVHKPGRQCFTLSSQPMVDLQQTQGNKNTPYLEGFRP